MYRRVSYDYRAAKRYPQHQSSAASPAEKRTALAIMRTGIAVFALPLSIFSALIATSKWYEAVDVWPLLALVSLMNISLIIFSVYLITRSLRRMHQYDRMIADIKYNNQSLRKLIKS